MNDPGYTAASAPAALRDAYAPRGALAIGGARDELAKDFASRMARARGMGFNVDLPLYHGTSSAVDFGSFRALAPWEAAHAGRAPGVSLAEQPPVANRFAEEAVRSRLGLSPTFQPRALPQDPAGSRVLPLFARSNGPVDYELPAKPSWGDVWNDIAIGGARNQLAEDFASRMARARGMGFNVDRPLFHGTPAPDFPAFAPLPPWEAVRTGRAPDIWTAENPEVAANFSAPELRERVLLAVPPGNPASPESTPRILPLFAHSENQSDHISLGDRHLHAVVAEWRRQ